jgi:hypothetical protein
MPIRGKVSLGKRVFRHKFSILNFQVKQGKPYSGKVSQGKVAQYKKKT